MEPKKPFVEITARAMMETFVKWLANAGTNKSKLLSNAFMVLAAFPF